MAQITAQMVKDLREMTGAGMMDCKPALGETAGEVNAAVDWLRKKGLSKAAKKADRVAAEGLISVAVKGTKGVVVEVNSETDFVARNELFQGLVKMIANVALTLGGDVEKIKAAKVGEITIAEAIADTIAKIGENMSLRRASSLSVANGVIGSYVHNSVDEGLGKIGVIVALESTGTGDELKRFGRMLAMHVAASNPQAVDPSALEPAAKRRSAMAKSVYRRVVVKVSGEALMGPDSFGIHQPTLERIAADLMASQRLGVAIAVVVGGGNIFRGVNVSEKGVARATGDMMGMLATVMNALALESAIEKAGLAARTMSALTMPGVGEAYDRGRALRHLDQGRVVLLAGGTGNPFFTTDTTAVLRAAEIGAEAVLKATNVDGVYSADPKKDPSAKRFDRLTHSQAIEGDYKVMDATAFALAREASLPIIVFSIAEPGSIGPILRGTGHGTVVAG